MGDTHPRKPTCLTSKTNHRDIQFITRHTFDRTSDALYPHKETGISTTERDQVREQELPNDVQQDI